MKTIHLLIGALTLAGVLNTQAQGVLAVDFPTPGQFSTGPGNICGWEFNVTSPVNVVALSYYDYNQDGLNSGHEVALYDSARTLLASATVLPGDPLTGAFRSHAITPVQLAVGNGYCISGTVRTSDEGTLRVTGLIQSPGIQYVKNRYGFAAGSGVSFPGNFLNATYDAGIFGPNFLIAAPEPERPRLSITPTATNTVLVSWPSSASNWVLWENTSLNPTNWSTSARTPVTVGTNSTVVVEPSVGTLFFRLLKP